MHTDASGGGGEEEIMGKISIFISYVCVRMYVCDENIDPLPVEPIHPPRFRVRCFCPIPRPSPAGGRGGGRGRPGGGRVRGEGHSPISLSAGGSGGFRGGGGGISCVGLRATPFMSQHMRMEGGGSGGEEGEEHTCWHRDLVVCGTRGTPTEFF